MQVIELYITPDCGLCKEVSKLLKRRQKKTPFELREVVLTEDHPKYSDYVLAVPVVVIDGTHELRGVTSEEQLPQELRGPEPSTRLFYSAKFLEALGLVTVLFGFAYGLQGDMWTDLYFLLGGATIFSIGRMLEKKDRRDQAKATRLDELQTRGR